MSSFGESLRALAGRLPEVQALLVMGADGIPIEKLILRPEVNLDSIAAEYTALFRASAAASSHTGAGALRELTMVSERLVAVLVAITPEYFLFAALSPGGLTGRARFALRAASQRLEAEFL